MRPTGLDGHLSIALISWKQLSNIFISLYPYILADSFNFALSESFWRLNPNPNLFTLPLSIWYLKDIFKFIQNKREIERKLGHFGSDYLCPSSRRQIVNRQMKAFSGKSFIIFSFIYNAKNMHTVSTS